MRPLTTPSIIRPLTTPSISLNNTTSSLANQWTDDRLPGRARFVASLQRFEETLSLSLSLARSLAHARDLFSSMSVTGPRQEPCYGHCFRIKYLSLSLSLSLRSRWHSADALGVVLDHCICLNRPPPPLAPPLTGGINPTSYLPSIFLLPRQHRRPDDLASQSCNEVRSKAVTNSELSI